MTVINLPGDIQKWKWKYCPALYAHDGDGGSTSNALKHVRKCRNRNLSLEKAGKDNSVQAKLNVNSLGRNGAPSLANWQYNHQRVKELAAHVILGHESPFMLFEGVIFNHFLLEVYPGYRRITRHAVKGECELFYAREKNKMRTALSKVHRVSLTTDLWWSGEQKIGYMAVTCHFIDSKWILHKRVLAFINVPPPHSGEVLARELVKVMEDWRIKDKVVSVSVDNASANDNCIARLKTDLTNRKNLLLDGQLFHVRCCAHILNLLVQDGLDVIKPVVEKIRGGVNYLLNSEARCKEFGKIVEELGLEEVNTAFVHYLPSDLDWEHVGDICNYLEGKGTVESIEKPHLHSMAIEMQKKYDKYWSQGNLLLSIGAFLDPRYKLVFISFVYPILYGRSTDVMHRQALLESILSLFNEYEKIYKKDDELQGCGKKVVNSTSSRPGIGKRSIEMYAESVAVVDKAKSDLDCYLEEDRLKVKEDVEFDVLQWWKANEPKYHVLSKLAKDVLSIPITTVASEATFSAGKRVIDSKRASMKVETVEMLLCGGDWVKEIYGIKRGTGKHILEADEERLAYDFANMDIGATTSTT